LLTVGQDSIPAVTQRGERLISETHDNVAFRSVGFSPVGTRVVAGGSTGTLRFFDLMDRLQTSSWIRGEDALVLPGTGPPAEGFEARARAREARTVVDDLFASLTFSEDVAAALKANTTLPTDVRRRAFDLVRARGNHIGWLNDDAVHGYRNRRHSREELALLLRKIELVNRLQPDVPDYAANLGKGQCHAGLQGEALSGRAVSE
jgi:hypothetical protein